MRCGRWILPSQHVRLMDPAKALGQVVLVLNSCSSCPSSADQTLTDIRHTPLQIVWKLVAASASALSVMLHISTKGSRMNAATHAAPLPSQAMHYAPIAILSSLARARSMMSSSPLATGPQ